MNKVSVTDLDLYNLRVLVRVDYNCPLDSDGKVEDDTRIRETLPTIKLIKEKEAKCIVLLSHLGRPKGRDTSLTLYPIAACLSKLLGEQITFIDDTIGTCVEKAINSSSGGRVILLENVRFYSQEEDVSDPTPENVLEFRSMLSKLGDVFVNDAFGCAHRAHSSVVGVELATKAAGLLMKKELDVFSTLLTAPTAPYLAIIGGAKVHDKIKMIEHLLDKVNSIIIGGGMAFTFLKVLYQMDIGNSLFDEEGIEDVKTIMNKADEKNVTIHLPVDFVVADKMDPDAETQIVSRDDQIPDGWIGLDIGPQSVETFKDVINEAMTIIWNGPMGVFEWMKFEEGTKKLLECVSERTASGATTVLGGGDTASAAAKWVVSNRISHISTGGGATLELLEGKVLPGVEALSDKSQFQTKQSDSILGAGIASEQKQSLTENVDETVKKDENENEQEEKDETKSPDSTDEVERKSEERRSEGRKSSQPPTESTQPSSNQQQYGDDEETIEQQNDSLTQRLSEAKRLSSKDKEQNAK